MLDYPLLLGAPAAITCVPRGPQWRQDRSDGLIARCYRGLPTIGTDAFSSSDEHRDLYWFRPLEHNTLHQVQ
jgi:hypothetical protein